MGASYVTRPAYARRLTRLVAQFIDGIVTAVPIIVAVLIGLLLGDTIGPVVMGAGAIAAVLYYLLADGLENGQSVAKRWFGIAVVDVNDGTPCTFGRSFIRNLALSVLGPLDWIFILFTERKQRLGDLIAGTVVVELKK